jgi:alkylation response protein AidB-like acyl-CoA dehydrogenase
MRWAAVAVAVSVHGLSCFPLATFGTPEQQERWLPELLGGGMLGAYSLSEPQAGSDAAALACKAERDGDEYVITGTKAWITSGGKADSYTLFARTAPGSQGVSCFLVPAGLPGLSFGEPEKKMGLRGVPTTSARYDGMRLPADRRIGAEGRGPDDRGGRWTPGRSASMAIAVRLASPPWTARSATPGSGRPLAGGSSSTRAWRSCSRTWPPRSTRPGRPIWTRPAAGTPGVPTVSRPAWPSWSRPTRP